LGDAAGLPVFYGEAKAVNRAFTLFRATISPRRPFLLWKAATRP
jgi:hypothetical protein